jgi:hypothetical protein
VRISALVCAALFLLVQNFPQPGPGIPGFSGGASAPDGPYADAVACWNFDASGDLGNDNCSTYDLSAVGSVTSDTGLDGLAIVTSPTNYMQAAASFPVGVSGAGASMSCWFYQTGSGGFPGLMATSLQSGGVTVYGMMVYGSGYSVTMRFRPDGDVEQNIGSPVMLTDSTWGLVTIWYDASDKRGRIQVNDGTVGTSNARTAANLSLNAGYRGTIGGGWTNGTFTGRIDSCGVWDYAQTAQQRADVYNSGAGYFYAAYLDSMFNDGLRFAWSERPELRRSEE